MRTIIAIAAVTALVVALATLTLAFAWRGDDRLVTYTSLGKVRSYNVSCTTAAGGVSLADTSPVSSLFVFVNSATPVYIGGTDVDSTHGMPVCTAAASCVASSLSLDVKLARCLSSSGTVTATVIAGSL